MGGARDGLHHRRLGAAEHRPRPVAHVGQAGAALSVPMDVVLRALRDYPAGATTAQLATRLRMKPAGLAARLGKQFMYGGPVERSFVRGHRRPQPIWSPR